MAKPADMFVAAWLYPLKPATCFDYILFLFGFLSFRKQFNVLFALFTLAALPVLFSLNGLVLVSGSLGMSSRGPESPAGPVCVSFDRRYARSEGSLRKCLSVKFVIGDVAPKGSQSGWRPSLLGARTLLGAPGLTTRSKDATRNKGHRY